MNKFVSSALALTMASPLFAGGSETEEWLTLDREIDSLASSLTQDGMGAGVSGFIKTSYANSGDVQPAGGGGNDLGGFSLDNARVNVDAMVGDYSFYIQLEGSDDPGFGWAGATGNPSSVGVLDATASFNLTETIKGTMGNFRPPFLGSALRDENNLLFIDKTAGGESWDFRDLGFMLSGAFEQFSWWAAVQNGIDAQGDDLAFTLRAAFNALGTATGSMVEGAYGAGEESNLMLAAGWYQDDDTFVDDQNALGVEAHYTHGALYAGAEIVDLDDGFGNATPWAATVSYMVSPDAWEVAARYEDFDDTADTTMGVLGVNRYIQGHNAKWQLNYSTIDSDAAALEIDVVALALVVGI